tara:strand:+ start:247 stop:1140 length:894 start_codon:yes stop_codon:yes gene_type:complete
MNKVNKVIVLGNGYVGKKVYNYLSSTMTDFDVVTMSKYRYDNPALLNEDLVTKLRPEFNHSSEQKWLVNCVGYTGKPNVDACESDKQKCWDLNVTFPTILADFCLQNNIKVINISSGCIYDGPKQYTEDDDPNFGISNGDSSWYSKTKHAAELCLSAYPNVYTLRIRMPVCNDFNSGKNYLTKLLKYNNLLQETNSKTVIEDLTHVVNRLINMRTVPAGIYNCVNPEPLSTKEVTEILDKYGMWNPHWKFINYEQLKEHITANRSNCVLSVDKSIEYGLQFPCERDSLERILSPNEE